MGVIGEWSHVESGYWLNELLLTGSIGWIGIIGEWGYC